MVEKCRLPTSRSESEIAWHLAHMGLTSVAMCRVLPVYRFIVPVLLAGAYRYHRGTITAVDENCYKLGIGTAQKDARRHRCHGSNPGFYNQLLIDSRHRYIWNCGEA